MPEPTRIFYDGACKVCTRQAERLARRDGERGRIELVDVADPGFDPGPLGRSLEQFNAQMHALEPGGELVGAMDAVRVAARAVGRGWMVAPTGWPVLRPLFDGFYRWFARNRYRFGGRRCDGDTCRID